MVNAFQISGADRFTQAVLRTWDLIEVHMIGHPHGEWFKVFTRTGTPVPGQWETGLWKDPYHHSRACLEIIHRVAGE